MQKKLWYVYGKLVTHKGKKHEDVRVIYAMSGLWSPGLSRPIEPARRTSSSRCFHSKRCTLHWKKTTTPNRGVLDPSSVMGLSNHISLKELPNRLPRGTRLHPQQGNEHHVKWKKLDLEKYWMFSILCWMQREERKFSMYKGIRDVTTGVRQDCSKYTTSTCLVPCLWLC